MTVDLIVLGLVAVGAVFGARAGAARQVAGWGALVVAALATRPGGSLLGPTFARAFHTTGSLGAIAASFATFIVVAVVVRLVATPVLQGVLGGRDPAERSTDRVLGALLGAGKVAAVAWVALSALAFVEANVQVTGKGLGISPEDSTAFAIARRWNLFSAPVFSQAGDLKAAQKVFRNPELFERVANHPAVAALEKNPRFRAVFADPEVKEALEKGDTVALLRNNSVHKLLEDPEALVQLAKLRQVVDGLPDRSPPNAVVPHAPRVK